MPPQTKQTVNIQLVLNNGKFTASAKKASRSVKVFGDTTVKQSRRISGAFSAITRPFTNLIKTLTSFRGIFFTIGVAKFLNIFLKLETALTNVLTLVDDANVSFETFRGRLLAISNLTGLKFDDLGKALFDIVSAGNNASDSLEILSVASRLAVAGNTDVASSAKALVAIMKTYNVAIEDATKVSNILFAAQKVGITTIKLLSNNTGKVGPTARAAGVDIENLTASISALTLAGLSTDEAGTAFRAILTTLLRPSKQAKDIAGELGIEFSTAAIRGGRLLEFIRELNVKLGGNAEAFALLFPNVRALGGILNLAADDAKNLDKALEATQNTTNETDVAFAKFRDNLKFNLDKVVSQFRSLGSEIIQAFKPGLVDASKSVQEFLFNLRVKFAGAKVRIVATVRTIIDRIIQVFQFLKEVISNGEILPLIAGAVSGLFNALFNLGFSLAPVLIKLAQYIGFKVGQALVNGVLGQVSPLLKGLGEQILSTVGFDTSFVKQLNFANDVVERTTELSADLFALQFKGRESSDFSNFVKLTEVLEKIAKSKGDLKGVASAAKSARDLIEDLDFRGIQTEEQAQGDGTLLGLRLTQDAFRDRVLPFIKENLFEIQNALLDETGGASQAEFLDKLKTQALELGSDAAKTTADSFIEGFDSGFAAFGGKTPRIPRFVDNFFKFLNEEALNSLPPRIREAVSLAARVAALSPTGIISESSKQAIIATVAEQFAGAINKGFLLAAVAAEEGRGLIGPKLPPGGLAELAGFQKKKPGAEPATQSPVNRILADSKKLVVLLKESRLEVEAEMKLLQTQFDRGIISGKTKNLREIELNDGLEGLVARASESFQRLGIEITETNDPLLKANSLFTLLNKDVKAFNEEQAKFPTDPEGGEFFTGLTNGIQKATEAFRDFGEIGVQVGQAIATEFASGLANAIVELDQTFQQFAINFLKSIAKLIIQSLILKAINSAFGFGVSVPTQSPVSRFSSGTTSVPGPNVNADVVPALLTPGEAVIKRNSSQYYGQRIMSAINNKSIPRELLESLLGGGGGALKAGRRTFRFAQGGEVSGGGGGASGGGPSYMLSDEQQAQNWLASGGKQAMLRWFQEDPDMIRGVLGTSRA